MRFVPRSAVYGGEPGTPPAQPQARAAVPQARAAVPVAANANVIVQQYKAALGKMKADRDRIVVEANKKLGALAARVRHLEAQLKALGHAPTLPPPNLQVIPGGKVATVGQPSAAPAQEAAAPVVEQTVEDRVQAAQDRLFYGEGDDVFYQGGENDD